MRRTLSGRIEVAVQCSAVRSFLWLSLVASGVSGCIGGDPSQTLDGGADAGAAESSSASVASPSVSAAPVEGVESIEEVDAGAALEPTTAVAPGSSACPADMVLVSGAYCPEVKQTCLRWLDEGKFWNFRCAVYGKPSCASPERTPMKFCIDRYEYTKQGDKLPEVHHSWTSAGAVCASQAKRLCLESEWQFACEGPDLHAYPYGDGFHRSAATCNIDRSNLGKPNAGLRDLRSAAGAHPQCVSPFGVHDMSGNVEEWTTLDHPADPKDTSSMKGAWWLPGRNHCRAATTGHGHTYEGGQVGVRCCGDVAK
ncbi:MAG: SUMF1/EgtB/PvdO family nonheme iron enzyme [Polyangiales bacterium]